jgi:GalNAc-alpha-(1->4)-GalNAc-alpha-(1->3)-diNAcBac-PP-undecaprenol alpha-1,4-N-acetyl-D-galactosaminyltransferase
MSLLANGLVARNHEVVLITLGAIGGDFYALDARVQRRSLASMSESASALDALGANFRRIRSLRATLRSIAPATVLSFVTHTNVLTLIACTGLRIRVVVSERVDPTGHRAGAIWGALRAVTYQHADAVVVQTDHIAQWFRDRLRHPQRVMVIPNPVVCKPAGSLELEPKSAPFILSAGRLVHQKGFDVLIRAVALAAQPGLRLTIAGEGPDLEQLQRLAQTLGVGPQVRFVGNVRNLPSLMLTAQAFVLASRYEGFPNVLLEALACGIPTIATSTDGARAILGNGKYGCLVPCDDSAALSRAIARLGNDEKWRQHLAASAPLAVMPFEYARVLDAWEAVLRPSERR